MRTKAKQDTTAEALKFYNDAEEQMTYLAGRWQDEKDYEDLNDYMKPLQLIAERAGVELISMTSSPFGVNFRVGDRRFHAFVRLNGSYEYVRTNGDNLN